jgi:hypothetical protein
VFNFRILIITFTFVYGLIALSNSQRCEELFLSEQRVREIAQDIARLEISISNQSASLNDFTSKETQLNKFILEMNNFLSEDKVNRIALYYQEKAAIQNRQKEDLVAVRRNAIKEKSEVENQKELVGTRLFLSEGRTISDLQITTDQKFLVAASVDNSVKVIELGIKEKKTLTLWSSKYILMKPDSKSFVTFSSDDKTITESSTFRLKEYELETGKLIYEDLEGESKANIEQPYISEDGRFVAFYKDRTAGIIRIVDLSKKNPAIEIKGSNLIGFSHDSKRLAFVRDVNNIALLNIETGVIEGLGIYTSWAQTGKFSSDDSYLIVKSSSMLKSFKIPAQNKRNLPFLQNSQLLDVVDNKVLTYSGGFFSLVDISTGSKVKDFRRDTVITGTAIRTFVYNSNYLVVVTSEKRNSMPDKYLGEVLDIHTLEKISEFQINGDAEEVSFTDVKTALSANGRFFAVAYANGNVQLFDLLTGELKFNSFLTQEPYSKLVFSSGSKYLIVVQKNNEGILMNLSGFTVQTEDTVGE